MSNILPLSSQTRKKPSHPFTLDSHSKHQAFHELTQYNMVVRLKACGTVAMGGGITPQRKKLSLTSRIILRVAAVTNATK